MKDIMYWLGFLELLVRLCAGMYLIITSEKGHDQALRIGVGLLLLAVGR